MEIRQVTSRKDIAATVRFAREVWTEHYVPIVGAAQVEYMLERFQSEKAIADEIDDGSLYFLLVEAGEVAGYVAVSPEEHALFLSKIYVRQDLRGRGYGRAMLDLVESICRERGLAKIWLRVNKANTATIAWYGRMGFENAGPDVKDIGGGFVMDDFLLEKTIAPEEEI